MSTNEKTKVPENAVCGPNGKPIAFPADMRGDLVRVAELVKERFGRDYVAECGEGNDKSVYLVPNDPRAEKALTVPERAGVEALAWYCREYTEGLKRNVSVTFPKVIHDRSDANIIIDDEPLSFGDEARAYMFAEVAEFCFTVDAQVIETPAGWAVTVSSERHGLSAEDLARLQGACCVLLNYSVEAVDDAYASQSLDRMHRAPNAAARQVWRDRKNAQAQRVEAKLDMLLARLDNFEAAPKSSAGDHVLPAPRKPAPEGSKRATPGNKTTRKASITGKEA